MKKSNQTSLKKLILNKKTISFLGPKSSSQIFGGSGLPDDPTWNATCDYAATCYAGCGQGGTVSCANCTYTCQTNGNQQTCLNCGVTDDCGGGGTEDCSRDCNATDGDCVTLTLSGVETCDGGLTC